MFCSNCGAEIREGSRFCTTCGNRIGGEAAPSDAAPAEPAEAAAAGQASFDAASSAPAPAMPPAASAAASPAPSGAAAGQPVDIAADRPASSNGQAADPDPSGGHLGPYELRGELGRGAMARVWRAFDPNLEREAAIKEPLFDPRLSAAVHEELGRRFVKEGKAAAKLNHPNIVTIYAADVYDGRPAIVMELVEGATLSDLLEAGSLSPSEALSVLDQLLDAVGYAHDHGVVHRDIKPDNIFVSAEGRVKLADFGIARVEDAAATRATVVGTVLGTPGYLSPEQAVGGAVDARSDLFSVGVVGYEMIAGENPFGSGDATTIIYRIVHEPPAELPAQACAGLPDDVRPAIMAALAKDPGARPPSAGAFKAALHGGVLPATGASGSGLVERATGAGAGAVNRKGALPRWLPFAAVGGICAIVLVVVLFMALSGGSGQGGATSQRASGSTAAPAAAAGGFYLGTSEGFVAVFRGGDSADNPYQVTDVSLGDLESATVAALGQGVSVATLDEANAKVDEYRAQAQAVQESRKTYPPPSFTQARASSELPADHTTSYYGPYNVLDGDFFTAWNEGGGGSGAGEWIELYSSAPQHVSAVSIAGGYNKSDETYYNNHRPRDIELSFSDGSTQRATLQDARGTYQRIALPAPVDTTFVRITVLSTYPGVEYEDCCIADIGVE